jgi:hypothetical protein
MTVIRFVFSVLLCMGLTQRLAAQSLRIQELFALLDSGEAGLDSFLVRKAFKLVEQNADSSMRLRYYTSLEPHTDEPTWVRSVSVWEVTEGSLAGRMIQYRTYQSREQEEMLSWLLQNEFVTVDRYVSEDVQHIIYRKEERRVFVKTGWATLPNKRRLQFYIWEVGK